MYHFLFVWRIHDNVFDALQRTECESIEATVRLLWSGVLLRMGDHRLLLRRVSMSGELENAGKRGPRKEK